MKKHLLLIMLMISATFSWAQSGWEEQNFGGDYTFKTNISFTLDFGNGDYVGDTKYEIAAFIGDEVRAFTSEYASDNGSNVYTLSVGGSRAENGLPILFKLYDPTSGVSYDAEMLKDAKPEIVSFQGNHTCEGEYKLSVTLRNSGWEEQNFGGDYNLKTNISFTLDFGNGDYAGNIKYEIAAFIGDEVRAFTSDYTSDNGSNVYTLSVGGSRSEVESPILFKVYDPVKDLEYPLEVSKDGQLKTLVFNVNYTYDGLYKLSAAIVSKIEFDNATIYKGSAGFVPEVKVNNGNLSSEKAPFRLTTEDTGVVTIGADNRIVPVAFGKATVTATYVDDETVTATFVVEVVSALESVVLDHEGELEYERTAEELIALPALVFNWVANAEVEKDEDYTVKSLAEDVIVIEGNNAKSLKAGVAELVYTSNYDASKCDTLIVNVTQGITKIDVAAHELYYGGEGYIPEVKVYRGEELVADAEYTMSYESEEPVVEIVDGNKINPLKIGTAIVKAACAKVETEFTVTVKSALESIALESNTLSCERTTDGEENITLPEPVFNWVKDNDGKPVVNNANVAYTITSSDKTVIRMDGLKAVSLKEGTVKLTYTSEYDATKSVVLTVNVKPRPIESIVSLDFENGIPENIILKDYDGLKPKNTLGYPDNTAWTVWQDPEDATNSVVASCSYYDVLGAANDWFVIPNITLPKDIDACQLYWRSRSAYDEWKDGYVVSICTETIDVGRDINSYTWKSIELMSNSKNPAQWESWHEDLSAYAGKTISIAFVNNTTNGWMLFLDDITIGKRESVTKGYVNIVSDVYAANGKGYVSFTLKAGILDAITSFTAKVTCGEEVVTQEFKGFDIKPNQYSSVLSLKTPVVGVAPEIKDFCLELIDSEGKCFASDSSCFAYMLDLEGGRNIVAESYINNYDIYTIQTIEGYKKYADKSWFMGLQLHGPKNSDPMTPEGEEAYTEFLTKEHGVDRCDVVLVDRAKTGHAYNDIEVLTKARLEKPLLLTTEICGAVYDNGITIDMSTIFAVEPSFIDYSYEFVLTEDGVPNVLWNRYSGGDLGEFNGYEKLDHNVTIPFNDVVRKRYKETDMVFGGDIAAGETVTNSHVLPMSSNVINPENLKMTVIITDNRTGEVINAARCALERKSGEAPETGVENIEGANGLTVENGVAAYSGESMVEMRVFTMHGVELLHSKGYKDVSIELPRENGVYIIEVLDNNNRYVKKVLR